MVLKSYAKINLSLSVRKKLTNGLHDIQSFFCLINLSDRITIKKLNDKKSDIINFVGPYSKYVDNLFYIIIIISSSTMMPDNTTRMQEYLYF